MRGIRKVRFIAGIFALVLIGLLLLGGLSFYVYQNSIKHDILERLNQAQYGELYASDVSFAGFQFFPYATFRFDSVVYYERKSAWRSPSADPILSMNEVLVGFRWSDFMSEEIMIGGLIFREGHALLEIKQDSTFNYTNALGVTPPERRREKSVIAELDFWSMEHVTVNFTNRLSDVRASLFIEQWHDSLRNHQSHTRASMQLRKLGTKNKTWIANQSVILDLQGAYEPVTMSSTYKNSTIQVGQLPFELEGELQLRKPLTYHLDLQVKKEALGRVQLSRPNSWLTPGKGNGSMDLRATLHGGTHEPSYTKARIDLRNLNITDSLTELGFRNVSLSGSYDSGVKKDRSDAVLNLDTLWAMWHTDTIKASLRLSNFKQPKINSTVMARLKLRELEKVWAIPGVGHIQGEVRIEGQINGDLPHHSRDWIQHMDHMNISMEDVRFDLRDPAISIRQLHARASLDQHQLKVHTLSFSDGRGTYHIHGRVDQYLPFLWGREDRIGVNLNLHARNPGWHQWFRGSLTKELERWDITSTSLEASFETTRQQLRFPDQLPRGMCAVHQFSFKSRHGPDIDRLEGVLQMESRVHRNQVNDTLRIDTELSLQDVQIQAPGTIVSLNGRASHIHDIVKNPIHGPLSGSILVEAPEIDISRWFYYDTTLAAEYDERFSNLSSRLTFVSSIHQLFRARPLPLGTFRLENLKSDLENRQDIDQVEAEVRIYSDSLFIDRLEGKSGSSPLFIELGLKNYRGFMQPEDNLPMQMNLRVRSDSMLSEDFFRYKDRFYLPDRFADELLTDLNLDMEVRMNSKSFFTPEAIPDLEVTIPHFSATTTKNYPLTYQGLQLQFQKKGDHYTISRFSGKAGDSDFYLTAQLSHLDPFFKKYDHFEGDIELKSDFIDWNQLLQIAETRVAKGSTSNGSHNPFNFPYHDVTFRVNVEDMKYREFSFSNVQGNVATTARQRILLDSLQFSTAGGHAAFKAQVDAQNLDRIWMSGSAFFDSISVERVLLGFRHQSSKLSPANHFKGKFSGEIQMETFMEPDFTVDLENSEAILNFSLAGGEINNYEPLVELQPYFDKRDVRHVRLGVLQNNLKLEDGVLFIPRMNIQSTLGQLYFSGEHRFNDTITYLLEVPFRLLTRVAWNALVKRELETGETGKNEIERARRGTLINLRLIGIPENGYSVKLGKGRERRRAERRQGK